MKTIKLKIDNDVVRWWRHDSCGTWEDLFNRATGLSLGVSYGVHLPYYCTYNGEKYMIPPIFQDWKEDYDRCPWVLFPFELEACLVCDS